MKRLGKILLTMGLVYNLGYASDLKKNFDLFDQDFENVTYTQLKRIFPS